MTTRRALCVRVDRLEGDNAPRLIGDVERGFWRAVENAVGLFMTEDAALSQSERFELLTPVEHIGWTLRFAEQHDLGAIPRCIHQPDLVAILRGYGRGVPNTLIGWALLTAWIPGDNNL